MPASSAPRARATLASHESAPKLMSLTNSGISRRSGFRAFGPITSAVSTGRVVQKRFARELGGQELHVAPSRELGERHAHGGHRPVMSDPVESVPGQFLNVEVEGFLGPAVYVRIQAEVLVALVGLRMRLGKGVNLGAIDEHGVLIRIQPGRELVERLVVVVLADAGIQAVVPLMDAADEVLAVDVAVGQEGTAVQAPSVQHRDLVPVADDDEIHLADEGVRGLAVLQLAPARDLYGRPRLRRCRHPRLPPWLSGTFFYGLLQETGRQSNAV